MVVSIQNDYIHGFEQIKNKNKITGLILVKRNTSEHKTFKIL